jgi:hypothetical protein
MNNGKKRIEMELMNLDNIAAVLQEFAVEVRNTYQDSLIRHNRIASGDLLNSVECAVDYDGKAYTVTLTLAEYWKYVENDTRPHWPPPSAILQWISVKPVIPRPDANGRIPSPKSLAYLIGRKIARVGTKGSHDLRDARTAVLARFQERISAALVKDTEYYIRKVFAGD